MTSSIKRARRAGVRTIDRQDALGSAASKARSPERDYSAVSGADSSPKISWCKASAERSDIDGADAINKADAVLTG